MVKVILTENHRSLGKKGAVIDMPEEVLQRWLDSGKAKLYSEDAPKKAKKKDSKK